MITSEQLAQHNSSQSCWVAIRGQVYDVTQYLTSHPGGLAAILRWAGKDATEEYEPIHPSGIIEKTLPPQCHLGPIDPSTILVAANLTEPMHPRPVSSVRPLSTVINLDEFEVAAEQVMSRRAWTYIHSAADSLGSYRINRSDWAKVRFRPRVLRNVTKVDMSRIIMGQHSALPLFIAPAAMNKLAHPDGELNLARGAAYHDIPYCVSTYSSVSHQDLVAELRVRGNGTRGCLFFQLYVAHQKEQTLRLIVMARSLGFKAIVITVDTPVAGKREEDEQYKLELDAQGENGDLPPPTAVHLPTSAERPVLRGAHSSSLNWDDLPWIREAWGDTGPVLIKGVQSAEDAKKAFEAGLDGIYLSNHGGRQIDDGPSSIRTLLEIRRFCPEILSSKTKIYMDGGCRRGADIVKALALGATAVAMGRPFIFAMSAYGTDGVIKAIQLLSDEIETTMRLLGVNTLDELCEDHVNTLKLDRDVPQRLSAFPPRADSKL